MRGTILITGGLGSNFIEILFQEYGNNIRIINIDKDALGRKDHKHLSHIPQIFN
jgi:hypothetical protein